MSGLSKILIIFLLTFLLTGSQDEKLFKLNRTFEVYGAAVRDLNELYVEDIDIDRLLKDGINGMLKELDPYTQFYMEQEKDKIDIITKGNYVGFGINISSADGMVKVTGFANDFMAWKYGMRIGDQIYQIDSAIVVGMNNDELKKYTQGVPGSMAKVKVIRLNDTLDLEIERHKVEVNNVIYYGRTQNGMGYIKLARFSRGATDEVEKAVKSLLKRNINGFILDLRDNPGGLLDEAVNISSLFLPKNTPIVSTKSKNKEKNYTYNSRLNPIDTEIPIIVLIDEGSASASEIVAGAIQDHDRGVIIGRTSFGKGLVQTIRNLPYNTSLKLTTARYYTPSGRLIQRKNYFDEIQSDTSQFFTIGGRPLSQRHGIDPDSTISKKQYSKFVTRIYNDDMIFNFGTKKSIEFEKSGTEITKYFKVTDTLISEFVDFLNDQSYIYQNNATNKIEELFIDAIELEKDEIAEPLLDSLQNLFAIDLNEQIELDKEDIRLLLQYEILKRFYNETDLTSVFIMDDKTVNTAESILQGDSYTEILTLSDDSDKNH